MMVSSLRRLGRFGLEVSRTLGESGLFLLNTLFRRPQPIKSFPLLVGSLYHVGVLSVVIIVVSALFIGMVVALQGYNTLEKFGAEEALGQLLALSVVRELGPVITALLFAGRAGSALTAEIGLMRSTEQLDSMEMMGVDPLRQVISPRLWAGFYSLPILALLFSTLAIFGGYLVAVHWLGLDGGTFWSNMQTYVDFRLDILSGIYKSLVFGFVATWIAVYQGFYAVPTATGVSRSTTKTVVYSSLAVLALDFLLTTIMMGEW